MNHRPRSTADGRAAQKPPFKMVKAGVGNKVDVRVQSAAREGTLSDRIWTKNNSNVDLTFAHPLDDGRITVGEETASTGFQCRNLCHIVRA
jgi:hypothetical protein